MENQHIHLRPATADDSAFLAWGVLTAIGMESPTAKQLQDCTALCRMDDVLYSHRNTTLALYNGKLAGMLCCYRGEDYRPLREKTFPIIARNCGTDYSGMEAETHPGEFYLDSMAVLPEFRHQGIGRTLLRHGMLQAARQGIGRCTLIVSPENPLARKLYESLGFRYEKEMFVFNEIYQKMAAEVIF